MKKIIALLLAVMICLGLAACGGGDSKNAAGNENATVSNNDTVQTPPAETIEPEDNTQLLDNYQVLDVDTFFNDCKNVAKLNTAYVGNAYEFTVTAEEIKSDFVLTSEFYNSSSNSYLKPYIFVKIYLPQEDLVEIEQGHRIDVIGVIDFIDEYESDAVYGYGSEKRTCLNVKPAKLVTQSILDDYEVLTDKNFNGGKGKTFEVTVENIRIEGNHILSSSITNLTDYKGISCEIYLSEAEMQRVKDEDTITVIGVMSDSKVLIEDGKEKGLVLVFEPAVIASK